MTKPANAEPPDIASASVPDTLPALHVDPDTGLTHAEVDVRRQPVDVTPQIAKRAYEPYEQRGRQDGGAVQDGGQAER